jgi:energy-coupling factor transporter ATP-binding protein EcfA2
LRLGDLLIRGRMVTAEEIDRAVEYQAVHGGRLGENLVATGAISQKKLEEFLDRLPAEPADIPATGLEASELMGLMMKLIYASGLESVRQFANSIKLPFPLVQDLVRTAVERKLLMSLGSRDRGNLGELAYMMTDEGRRWTLDLLNRSGYSGPAPVPLEQFTRQVNLQKITNEVVTFDRIRRATSALTFEDAMIEQCGPALNSGRATLLYGPSGNGKTSVARCLANVFHDVIFVPYAVDVEGQTIRVFDPSVHMAIDRTGSEDDSALSLVRRDVFDARWVACHRPCVIAGGELTLDMLDLRYDTTGHFYEAPLHVKALGGCFVIDDFGHQLISPTDLLNRWVVPLENRVDYLKLHTGKTFTVPFEELIIFSTNLEPEDMMDAAFLRRLPYKIEVGAPTLESYRTIFEKECAKQGFELPREVFETIVYKIRKEKGLELARYQPKFIVDQVAASCRFMQQPPRFEPRFVNYALDNLRAKHRSQEIAAKAA